MAKSMYAIKQELDQWEEAFKTDMNLIEEGDSFSKADAIQLAKLSFYSYCKLKDALLEIMESK